LRWIRGARAVRNVPPASQCSAWARS
jgi:hypothetical protein